MPNSRRVYSTEAGGLPAAERPAQRMPSPSGANPAHRPPDGIVRIFRERAGRAGKTVTVIRGLAEPGARLDVLAAELKRHCGAGGAVKQGAVEIQGDHRERVAERLRALGYTVRLAGG
jgi:translation initiation factor 1